MLSEHRDCLRGRAPGGDVGDVNNVNPDSHGRECSWPPPATAGAIRGSGNRAARGQASVETEGKRVARTRGQATHGERLVGRNPSEAGVPG